MKEYLRTQQPELARIEIDTQEELQQSILYGNTIQADNTVDRRGRICSRTARKWLNHLKYKWKNVQKRPFFYGYE